MQRAGMFAGSATRGDDYAAQNLGIHEDAHGNVFVKDLSVIPVSTPEVRTERGLVGTSRKYKGGTHWPRPCCSRQWSCRR